MTNLALLRVLFVALALSATVSAVVRAWAAGRMATSQAPSICERSSIEFFGGLPLIQARVNDAAPLWFLLDTASSFTLLNTSVAETLGLQTAGGMAISSGKGDAARIVFSEEVDFAFGNVKWRSRAGVMSLQMKYDRPLAGILGAPFFQAFVTRLDFAASRLDVCDPVRFTPPLGAEGIPFRIEEEIPLIEIGLRLQGREEIVAPVFVDTGASQAVTLNRPFVAAHRLSDGQVLEERRAGSLTGTMTYSATRGAFVRIGNRVHSDVLIGFMPSERTNRAGVIGNTILRNYVLVLDYRNRRMYLQDPERR